MNLTLYELLEVDETAFRKKARKHHPDLNRSSPESAARFRIFHNAYSVLCNQKSRREYDSYLATSIVFSASSRSAPIRTQGTSRMMLQDGEETLTTAVDHLNYLLWEIDDLIRQTQKPSSMFQNKAAEKEITEILVRIDDQILKLAGFPDYFYKARRIDEPRENGSFSRGTMHGHQPFVNTEDYFYNIRRRANEFFDRVRLVDITKPMTNSGQCLLDSILEIHNYGVRILSHIRRSNMDDTADIANR